MLVNHFNALLHHIIFLVGLLLLESHLFNLVAIHNGTAVKNGKFGGIDFNLTVVNTHGI